MKRAEFKSGKTNFFTLSFSNLYRDKFAFAGFLIILIIFLTALTAPLLANGRPLILLSSGKLSFPFLRYIFAPMGNEVLVSKVFNYLLLLLPGMLFIYILFSKLRKLKIISVILYSLILIIPFFTTKAVLDKKNWLDEAAQEEVLTIFAPVPYNPSQIVAKPYEKPSSKHIFGTDQIGRDVFARMIYGARISLAVGFAATLLTLVIGVIVGLISGYLGGRTDIIVMRLVEIIICFPTFLLLLILITIMMDRQMGQSIILVIIILGITGWTGLARLVRGEVLKQRSQAYVLACESAGLPLWRILLFHILPNVTAPIYVNFSFGVAGAILAESGLSFLGFGVQDPTSSWGELLRQAFSNPFEYWHLTLWPGIALFLTVSAFNFLGDGIRKALDPKAV